MPKDWNQIVNLFRGATEVRFKPGFWNAFCPYHKGGDERQRSLRIWIAPSGHLWIRCYTCGDSRKNEILQCVGLKMRDLFDDDKDDDWYKKTSVRPKVIAKYNYADETGMIVYQQWRYEPKGFFPHRIEDGVPKPGLLDIRRIVYRIPDLLANKTANFIFIVEGEGKADLLWSWGFPATACLGGCGMGWTPDYSHWLVKHFPRTGFFVLPDNDPPGFRHAGTVVGSLLLSGAHGVGFIELPDLPPKGDIKDYIQAGGTKEEFTKLIRNAARWKRS